MKLFQNTLFNFMIPNLRLKLLQMAKNQLRRDFVDPVDP